MNCDCTIDYVCPDCLEQLELAPASIDHTEEETPF